MSDLSIKLNGDFDFPGLQQEVSSLLADLATHPRAMRVWRALFATLVFVASVVVCLVAVGRLVYNNRLTIRDAAVRTYHTSRQSLVQVYESVHPLFVRLNAGAKSAWTSVHELLSQGYEFWLEVYTRLFQEYGPEPTTADHIAEMNGDDPTASACVCTQEDDN